MDDRPFVGEEAEFGDEVALGDIVYFERQPSGHLLIRRLRESEAPGGTRTLFRLQRGRDGRLQFQRTLFPRAHVYQRDRSPPRSCPQD